MKKFAMLTLGVLSLGVVCIAFTVEGDVPGDVHIAFQKKFPNAYHVRWSQELKREWEAEFELNGKDCSAIFTEDGDWVQTETEFVESEIPSLIIKGLEERFDDFDIEEIEVLQNHEGNFYEVQLEQDDLDLEVILSVSGKIIEIKKEIDED